MVITYSALHRQAPAAVFGKSLLHFWSLGETHLPVLWPQSGCWAQPADGGEEWAL